MSKDSPCNKIVSHFGCSQIAQGDLLSDGQRTTASVGTLFKILGYPTQQGGMEAISLLPLTGKGTGSTLPTWLNLLTLLPESTLKTGFLCSSPKIKWAGGKLEVGERQKEKRPALLDFAVSSPPSPRQRKTLLKHPCRPISHSMAP